jgi:hypothetical protein
MIAVARAEDTIQKDRGDGVMLTVPDLKLPQGVEWTANGVGVPNVHQIHFTTAGGKYIVTLWDGPHVVNGETLFFIDAPKAVLQQLRDQLGAGNVAPLIKALRAKPALRAYCKSIGMRVVRNSSNVPVTVLPRIVIAGHSPVDLDGDELDEADELPDLE